MSTATESLAATQAAAGLATYASGALPGVADPLAAAYIAAELAKLDEREAELLATAPAGDPETLGPSLRLMQARLRVMMYRERILSGASRRIARVPGATPQPVAAETSATMPQPPVVAADIPPRWVPGATPQQVAAKTSGAMPQPPEDTADTPARPKTAPAPVHQEPISVGPKPIVGPAPLSRPAEDAKPSTEATPKSGALPQAPAALSSQAPVQLPPAPVLPPQAAAVPDDPLRPPPHLKGRKRNQWLKKMRHRPSLKPIDLDLLSADLRPIPTVSLPP